MLVLGGAGVLTVALALHVAWVAKRAQAKGRSAAAWVALALVLAGAGLRAGIALFLRAADLDSDVLMAVFATSPFTLAIAPLIVIVLVLNALPVRVVVGAAWPVFEKQFGAGKLVIGDEAIDLRWDDGRSQRIARAALTATADQESLRITWDGGELLVMPTGAPATREGRIQQARTIASRLSS